MSSETNMVKREQALPERTREQAPGTMQVIPTVDVYENDDELLLIADMPGVLPDALDIRLEDSELSIRGAQQVPDGAEAGYVPLEFARVFTVHQAIDPDKVKAELKGGVLRLGLPKSEAAKPRRIKVTGG